MMALSDPEAEHFGETKGSEFSSRISTPTPMNHKSVIMNRSPSQVSSMGHTMNVNYCHCYFLEKKDGNKIDIPELIESLVQHTQLQSSSKMLQPSPVMAVLKQPTAIIIVFTFYRQSNVPPVLSISGPGECVPLLFTSFY